MIATNTVSALTASLRALVQRIREEFNVHAEFHDGDGDVIESGVKTLDQTDGELLALGGEEESIQTNRDLSDEGKRKAMTQAIGRSYKALGPVRKAAQTKRAAADEARTRLTATPKADVNETVDYLRGAEIRQRLREMPQTERMTLFAKAVAEKNVAVLRGLKNDPLGEELLPAEYMARVQQEHLQQTEGAQWQRVQTLILVAEKLELLATAIDLAMHDYGKPPAFPTPPIRNVDLGQVNTQAPPPKSKADAPPPGGVRGLQ